MTLQGEAHQHHGPVSLAATHNNSKSKEAFFTDEAYYMENPLEDIDSTIMAIMNSIFMPTLYIIKNKSYLRGIVSFLGFGRAMYYPFTCQKICYEI